MSARRTPYAHNETPPSASAEPDNKIWLDQLNPPNSEELEVTLDGPDIEVADPPKKEEKPEPVVVVADPEPSEPVKPSADDEAYNRLKSQLDRERQAREAAQRRSEQLETDHRSTQERLRQEQERQQELHRSHLEAQEIAISNAISYAESQAAQAQREITRALNEGDYEASANAYRALAKAESDLSRLNEGKQAVEIQKKVPVERHDPVTTPQQRQPQSTYERVEAYITQPAHSLRAQQYMRDHYDDLFRDFDSGAARLNKLLGGHYLAKSDGVPENTDSYFDFLDKHMGYRGDLTPQVKAPVTPAPKKAVPPSAPVSRGSSNDSVSGTKITLTRAEVDFCKESGVSPTEYARNKLAALKGASDPSYTGPRFSNDR